MLEVEEHMMNVKENRPLLQELSSLLKSLPRRPEGPGHKEEYIDAPGYLDEVNAGAEASTSNSCQKAGDLLIEQVGLLVPPPKQMSILSIGCGCCDYEVPVLNRLQNAFPDMTITFYGVDYDRASCTIAEKRLADLPCEATIIKEDFMAVDVATLPIFDFVQCYRSHYYFLDKKAFLKKALHLLNPSTGKLHLILHCELTNAPVWMMPQIFHERLSARIIPDIVELELDYTSSTCDGYVRFERCIKEGFESQYGKKLMNILCKSKLEDYPPEVRAVCIAYIMSIMDEEHKCYSPETHVLICSPKKMT